MRVIHGPPLSLLELLPTAAGAQPLLELKEGIELVNRDVVDLAQTCILSFPALLRATQQEPM